MAELETLTAFRAWILNEDHTRLCAWGTYVGEDHALIPWPSGINKARCLRGLAYRKYPIVGWRPCVAAPDENCHCGLHAIHSLSRVSTVAFPAPYTASRYCIGIVQAWGKTIVHHDGIRAEFMRPIALCRADRIIGPIIEGGRTFFCSLQTPQIGLPIIDLADAEDFAKEYGTLSGTLLDEEIATKLKENDG